MHTSCLEEILKKTKFNFGFERCDYFELVKVINDAHSDMREKETHANELEDSSKLMKLNSV